MIPQIIVKENFMATFQSEIEIRFLFSFSACNLEN